MFRKKRERGKKRKGRKECLMCLGMNDDNNNDNHKYEHQYSLDN